MTADNSKTKVSTNWETRIQHEASKYTPKISDQNYKKLATHSSSLLKKPKESTQTQDIKPYYQELNKSQYHVIDEETENVSFIQKTKTLSHNQTLSESKNQTLFEETSAMNTST
jgi:hypothetical protein